MSSAHRIPSDATSLPLDGLLPDLEAFYKDLHSHPELSVQETRTAGLARDRRTTSVGPIVRGSRQ